MTRHSLLVAAVLLVGMTSASAQGPLDGRWALYPEACDIQPGEGDGVPLIIEGNDLLFYESACTITSWTPIGTAESAWHVTMDCGGEGELWTEEATFALARDVEGNLSHLVSLDTNSGVVDLRSYCGQ